MQPKHSFALALLAAALLTGSASAANYIVVEARGIALKPGTAVDAAKPLTPQAGPARYVDLGILGATLQLDGPYDQPPSAGGQGRSIGATLAALGTEHNARTGEAGRHPRHRHEYAA